MAAAAPAIESVQCFGRKKTAVAVTYCKRGRGLIKINGCPIELIEPEILRYKAYEPILLLGRSRFSGVDMRIRVKGGGHTSQIYAIRQSIAKALVAFYQKYVDEQSKKEIKDILVRYDRTLLVADPRRCEPKKFGGRGARASSVTVLSALWYGSLQKGTSVKACFKLEPFALGGPSTWPTLGCLSKAYCHMESLDWGVQNIATFLYLRWLSNFWVWLSLIRGTAFRMNWKYQAIALNEAFPLVWMVRSLAASEQASCVFNFA
ncbi:hypothetical protein RHSIM_Rhsim04G0204500 [Rhododendron simsii]|uniref:40S ribosomal protein S16 n=1 Tax=Rhododendron simsii TaxID=118357 RepID=A0A834LQ57_RHOSS|nr:hypothetical protein RHSIM_Rhsim04G0204500 [Rhododendron simsii]